MKTKAESARRVPSAVFLIAAALLACAGAFAYREAAGLLRTYPLLPLLMVAAAFLPVPAWQRGILFLIPTCALLIVGMENSRDTVVYCVLAVILFVLSEAGVRLIRKGGKRIVRLAAGVLLLCLCLALYAAVCGNPFSAHAAQKKLNAYLESEYVQDGGLTFSGIRYDYRMRSYGLKASSRSYPTETASISVNGPITEDRFLPLLEDQSMRSDAGKVALALRAGFSSDVFTVLRVSISGFKSGRETPHTDSEGRSFGDRLSVCVELYGSPLYSQLAENSLLYANSIHASGSSFRSLEFVSVQTFRTRYRASFVPAGYTPSGYESVRPSVFAMRDGIMLGILETNGLRETMIRILSRSDA
ncbi:MAG: hypothetical protein ILO68_06770 [Clostridia bacterium]|nr:hypothetical protein [Clostridia bacterium]